MTHVLHKLAINSMRWNALESIVYQLALCMHQAALFYTLDIELYGLAGVIFSGIYTVVGLANLGLDSSLGAWWQDITKSQRNFRLLFVYQLIPQLFLVIPTIFFFVHYGSQGLNLTGSILICICLLVILECLKRTLKLSMYLQFANHKVAPTEIVSLVLYIGIVWGYILRYKECDLLLLFLPMVLTSAMTVLQYASYMFQLYARLPDQPTTCIPIQTIINTRLLNYTTQLTHLVFSGNVLIPLFSYRFGLPIAATLKLVNTIAYAIGTIMHKVVGTTSQALFSYTRTDDPSISKSVFATCTNNMYQLIYLTGIICIFNCQKIPFAIEAHMSTLVIMIFGSIIITENICNIYEHFLMVHGNGYYSTITQLCSFLFAYCIIIHANMSLLTSLIALLMIRILSIVTLELIVRHYWAVCSHLKIKPIYGICGLAVALFTFLLF